MTACNTLLIEQLNRLVHLARNVMMKRALADVQPDPHLNFWRLIRGNQMDIAVLEWCKVFGANQEETHWKKVVPDSERDRFRERLLGRLDVTPEIWDEYWNGMKSYRDNLAAHHNETNEVSSYPDLELALRSAYFYYSYLIGKLRESGETRFPNDLEEYCHRFESQARDIAGKAIAATAEIEESVN